MYISYLSCIQFCIKILTIIKNYQNDNDFQSKSSISIDLNARKNLNNRIWGFEKRQLAKRP